MSFSKAKIIRFNDVVPKNPSTPSSANPNPSKDKASERTKKAASSIGNQSPTISENGSVRSVPGNFKTPTLPKKTKTAISATKLKPNNLFITNDLEALKEKTQECESKTKYIHKLTEELDSYKTDLDKLKLEKEQLQREHQNELQGLELEMLQTMTKLQKQEEEATIKLKDIQRKFEKEMEAVKKAHEYKTGQLVLDYEINMRDLRELSEQTLKTRLEELENIWKQKLQDKELESEAILKECQAISEYSIIECELEKKEIQKSLDETRATYDQLKKAYEKLEGTQENLAKSYANKEKELKTKINNLNNIIQEKEEDVKKLITDIKTYQLTISNSQMTIEVLKKRLIDSDRDVEQLKKELTRCEEKLLEYERKYLQLNLELKEAKEISDDLDLQYESAIHLNEDSIQQLKKELLGKVNFYQRQVQTYCKKFKEEEELKEDIIEQLNNNIEIIKQINFEVEKTEEFYSLKTKDLEEIIDSYKLKEKSLLTKTEALNEENQTLKTTLKQTEHTIEQLEDRLQQQQQVLNSQCEHFKAKSKELELEAKESAAVRKKYIDISGKYDALLQDFEGVELENRENKSRMVDIRKQLERFLEVEEECEKLKKANEILESENLSYKNKFEELKLKKYKFAAKDKENVGSPNNRSAIESPNRGSPFRERN